MANSITLSTQFATVYLSSQSALTLATRASLTTLVPVSAASKTYLV